MIIKECKGNIFTEIDSNCYYAHCISSDYVLGAGIAVQFEEKFDLKRRLNQVGNHSYPDCILVDNVFNLITKDKYWNKPTYETLKSSLMFLYDYIDWLNITYLVIPKLGCGLDGLSWNKVKKMIEDIFKPKDITIAVYYI